ncbi:reverse transcriptase domain-containing protein [Tanacetum coccineum]
MSAMANTTPIVTTVTKTATKEKTPKEADAAPRVNILDFCEEHYEDILPVIMDKIRRDKRKEVHTRLDFGESSKKSQRMREGSQNSSAGTLPARYRNSSERPKMRDRLRSNDGNVFGRLDGTLLLAEIVLEAETAPAASKNHMRHQRWRTLKVKVKRRKPTDEEDLAVPWTWTARVWFDELPSESIDGYKDLKEAFLTYFMQQKKYVKDPVEIHSIKQRDGETIKDFMERFKVETGRIKGAPECM